MTAKDEVIRIYANMHRHASAMKILAGLQDRAGTEAWVILSRAQCYLLYGNEGMKAGVSTRMFDPVVHDEFVRKAA